jgi:hypothetical protein
MTKQIYPNIADLRHAYRRQENITKILSGVSIGLERAEIIEIAYDIQAGSYTRIAQDNPEWLQQYAFDIHELARGHLAENDVILDCGAGELTTLSALSNYLPVQTQLLACDISLSRLRVGRRFAKRVMKSELAMNLNLFVADMASMPLPNKSVDVILTSHALEPNHGRESELLNELLRITRRKLILFEPSWEHASEEVRARMEEHGYVRDLPRYIKEIGASLVSVDPLLNSLNSMNPTYCYVIEPADEYNGSSAVPCEFSCPRSGVPLQKQQGYWWSSEGGWAYPEIDGIACLREKHGVLMSHE